MTRRVHVARPVTPLERLVQLIEENNISALPIVDAQGIPVGIVSESDLLRAKAEGVFAWEIMSKPPITVRSDATLPQATRLMEKRNVGRLVVVDARGKIVGIVSRTDLLQVFLGADDEVRNEVASAITPRIRAI